MSLQDQAFRTVTVPLRLEWFDGVIRTIQLSVIDLDDLTEEIRVDGQTVGYIGHAGHIFVALTGARLDLAEECGQCLLWDKAAAILVTTFGHLPEPEQPDPRAGAPEYTTGDRERDVDGVSSRRRSRTHEMAR